MSKLKVLMGGVGVAGLVVLGVVAGSAVAGIASSGDDKPAYGVNKSGQTFGSLVYADSPENEPDLIEAIATNGKVGYVLKADLDADPGLQVKSPEEAVAYMESTKGSSARVVPVYAEDGKTKIGVFVVLPPQAVEHREDGSE